VKFQFIATEKAHHALSLLCRCMRVTRSGFYAWRRRPESTHAHRDRRLKVLVHASFAASKRRYGSPRIHRDLIEQRERVRPVAPNLLDREFTAAAVNQRWVGDTTEFVIGESGTLYLAAILDLFSRFVVGWAISVANDRHLTIEALEMALKRRGPATGLLHHSDRGSPYASEDYQTILQAHGITCSMSRSGDCFDNAVMEAFFSTVKMELGDRFDTGEDATRALFEYLEVFYNQRRRHSTIGYVSPAVFEQRARSASTSGRCASM
jgi:putative transposase